jgi:hypothetical protein
MDPDYKAMWMKLKATMEEAIEQEAEYVRGYDSPSHEYLKDVGGLRADKATLKIMKDIEKTGGMENFEI